MLSALPSSERGQPAVPLARQLAHQRFVRPGPLVLGAAPRKSPTPTTDRDRTVSRMLFPHCCGHRLYLHPVCRGRRVMRSLISQCEETSSSRRADERVVTGAQHTLATQMLLDIYGGDPLRLRIV